jgi:hypothetical protein
VVFNANIPEGVTAKVTGLHAANSGFIYGQDLPGLLPDTPPTLSGYIFQGYFDAPVDGKKYYDSSLDPQIVFDKDNDGNPDEKKWDKAGPEQTLYAHWEIKIKDYAMIGGVKWALKNVDAPGTFTENEYDYGMFYQWGRGKVGWSSTNPVVSVPSGETWFGNNIVASAWDMDNENPCPAGWEVPTKEQLALLLTKLSTWEVNYLGSGIRGVTVADGAESLFLPAAGFVDTDFYEGPLNYWSSSYDSYGWSWRTTADWGMLMWVTSNYTDNRRATPIRCVAK